MFNTNSWLSAAPRSNCFNSSYIQGILDICGNIVLRNGGFSLPEGDVSMNGNLYVGQNATFIGDVSMNGNLWVGSDVSFNKNVSVQGNITTSRSIYQIDGKENMNIASSVGTFPNYGTAATGPNLINIGNSNFNLVSNRLRDSIAIGSDIIKASNPTGDSNIGIGKNIFPGLETGSQNIGIGKNIATSLTIGYNNIFIGTDVARNVSSGGNIIAIGAEAGTNAGEGCTFFGAVTRSLSTSYTKSTAIGYDAIITKSNQIKFCGNVAEPGQEHSVCVPGSMRVDGPVTCTYFSSKETFFEARRNSSISILSTGATVLAPTGGQGSGLQRIYNLNSVLVDAGYFKAPVSGYYVFFAKIGVYGRPSPNQQQETKWEMNVYAGDIPANVENAAEFYVNWADGNTNGRHAPIVSALRILNAGDSVKIVARTNIALTNDPGTSISRTYISAMLLATI
jgi:predicted acyltransferase (DUF342 family)